MTAQDCFRNEPLCPRHLAPPALLYGFLAPSVTSNADIVPVGCAASAFARASVGSDFLPNPSSARPSKSASAVTTPLPLPSLDTGQHGIVSTIGRQAGS
jgi:hypothetical protein